MNKADQQCCVPHCSKTRLDNVIIHIFPNPLTQPDRFHSWVLAIGGELWTLDDQKIFKYRRVCHNHFEEKFHTRSKRLSADAVPTLCLTRSLLRQPLVDVTNQSQLNKQVAHTNQPTTSKADDIHEFTDKPPVVGQSTIKSKPSPRKEIDPFISSGLNDKPSTSMQSSLETKSKIPADKGYWKIKTKYMADMCSTEASILTRQIKRLQAAKMKYATKLKKALKLTENPSFQKALKNFTSAALIFTLLQFRERNKDKMGRRYTKKEKILSLAAYKQGPRAYRWLRYIFVLPSPVTLSRMISRASIRPGINQTIFDHLKKRARRMSANDKLCLLMFDEIAIAPDFQYNRKRDYIIGFVNYEKSNEKKIADHALVFMIRGIQRNYKQPISYTFCSGSTPKAELVVLIKEHIKMLKSVGFTILATVCDQGATNMSAINYLINETKIKYMRQNEEWRQSTFEVNNDEIVPLYDPPHLIKGIRNNLLNKNLLCTIDNVHKTGKWEHILQLYRHNPSYRGIRLLPKLTEYHVDAKKIPKMKVKHATQVFSTSVGINMGYLAEEGILDAEVKDTADIILFFDELFDSVNGSSENFKHRPGKPLLGALTSTSSHNKVWEKARSILKSMKFKTNQGKCGSVPTIFNWLHNIDNILILKKKIFEEHDMQSLWLRHFNQDPLENFFGCIRSHGGRNINPSCTSFENSFASLLINNLSGMHSPGANCEKDSCGTFQSSHKIFFTKRKIVDSTCNEINFEHISNDNIFVDIETKNKDPKIKAQLEYVTGFVLKKLKKIYKRCEMCSNCLSDDKKTSDYIKRKDYSSEKKYLSYPTPNLIEQFSKIQDIVTYVLSTDSNMINIKNYLKTLLSIVCDFNFIKCKDHKNEVINEIQDTSCRFFLNSWCKDVNRILKGARNDFSKNDSIQKMAYQYFQKRIKKK